MQKVDWRPLPRRLQWYTSKAKAEVYLYKIMYNRIEKELKKEIEKVWTN